MPTGSRAYFAPAAWLPEGWAGDVRIAVGRDGLITAVTPNGDADDAERLGGAVVPGMVDVHSHAFQRAMAGLAERAGPAGDSFWSWRQIMYGFLAKLGPAEIEAIAAQLYVELLKHGYTTVVEFHYLHNDPRGTAYENASELADRIVHAAGAAGIGLTLLPVLYQASDFGGVAPTDGQRRFVLPTDDFLALVHTLQHRYRRDPKLRIGVAPHSLRAVTPDTLRAVLDVVSAHDVTAPIHIHVAEQTREVDACLAWSGQRPVEWLLANAQVDARWCLVHATHMTPDETKALAASGAVAGLCPTTEANLGDGLFALPDYLAAAGRIAVGSDSNVATSPVEELRWLEYGQRLRSRARNVAERAEGTSTGAALYARALAGGAQAAGQKVGAIAVGRRADLVVLDADHPSLVGRSGDALIDSWIFCGNESPVTDVVVAGEWLVRDGRHVHEDQAAADFARVMRRLS
jgi:formimidoylglutamate deiminase